MFHGRVGRQDLHRHNVPGDQKVRVPPGVWFSAAQTGTPTGNALCCRTFWVPTNTGANSPLPSLWTSHREVNGIHHQNEAKHNTQTEKPFPFNRERLLAFGSISGTVFIWKTKLLTGNSGISNATSNSPHCATLRASTAKRVQKRKALFCFK